MRMRMRMQIENGLTRIQRPTERDRMSGSGNQIKRILSRAGLKHS